MDFRNKYVLNTVRIVFGLFMAFSGVSGFLAGPAADGVPEPMAAMTQALWDSGLFPLIKATELVAGLMLAFNLLPALAAILLAPVAVGIIVFNAMVAPAYLASGAVVAALNGYLGYAYWERYKPLFRK